jgi:hypothetical protein
MKTRSQTQKQQEQLESQSKLHELKKPFYEVNIDFDKASTAWRSNKKAVSNGCYKYICISVKKEVKCGRMCYKNLEYCWQHRKCIL